MAAKSALTQFAVFFETAQRLLGAFEAGRTNVPGIDPCCSACVVMRVPTSRWVSRAACRSAERYRRGRGRQIVPQRLRLLGQKRIVEHEAGEILDHAQPFGGPVQRGVEDS